MLAGMKYNTSQHYEVACKNIFVEIEAANEWEL